jgi:predicted RND superfamily exporter protein
MPNEMATIPHELEGLPSQPAKEKGLWRFSMAAVTRHSRSFLLASLLFATIFILFVPQLKTVDDLEYFFDKDKPAYKFYKSFKEVFGKDEFFIVAFHTEHLFTERNLRLLKKITNELEGLDDVRKVRSLANVDDTIGAQDYFEVRRFLEEIPTSPDKLERLKIQATANPLYAENLISRDGKTAAIVVHTYDRPDDRDYRRRLVHKTERILDPYRDQFDRSSLAGVTVTSIRLVEYMAKDMAVFVPLVYGLMILAIWAFFRNLRMTVLAVINIFFCLGSTVGLFGLTGITLNNLTSTIIPLVAALSLCDTVHIFSHMDKRILEKLPDKRRALASVLDRVLLPCFLTTLTTGIGFLSLAVSEIEAIRDFAWIASGGMVFEFIYSFCLLPPLILFFAPEKIYKDFQTGRGMTPFLGKINQTVNRYARILVLGTGILVAAAFWFAGKVQVETNPLDFFRADTPVRKDLAFVEEHLAAVNTLDISLKAERTDAFQHPMNLMVIDQIQQYANSLKGVDKTFSFGDYVKDMNESFHNENPQYRKIPATEELVAQYLLIYDSDEIEDYINGDLDHARISVRISEHSNSKQKRLIQKLEDYIARLERPDLDIRLTGFALQHVNLTDTMLRGQTYSLAIAVGVISLIMFLVLRSLTIGFLSIIPNLFPILLNFGMMGAVGVPLNTATALIAAVAIGIAVDDTIHFLSEYKTRRANGASISESVRTATLVKGRAIITSSTILCAGFGVLVTSTFVPSAHFGLLTAIVMFTAVVGDMVVLPALLLSKESRGGTTRASQTLKLIETHGA